MNDLDGVKEAKENLAKLNETVTNLQVIVPTLQNQLLEIKSAAEELSKVGEEMFHAYTEKGKAAGDLIMKRKETGLDERSEILAGKMDEFIKTINEKSASNDQEVRDALTEVERWPIIFSLASIFITVIFLFALSRKINASVEAARAGEHGKGFAVVAEEVGNLAQMSGAASQEISKLLEASVKKVESIVKSSTSSIDVNMKNAKGAVDRGNEVAQECAKALGDIVNVFREVKESVSSISQASQEQFYGVSEVSKALHQIDVSTQVALKSSQNATKVADELATKLKNLQDASGLLTKAIEGVRKIHRFAWTDEYLTGVELMDEEHKVLIEKMNTLIDNMGNASNAKHTEIIRNQYKDLADYAVKHFDDEENYFSSINYPHVEAHKEMHRKLIAKVVELEGKIGTPEFDPFAISNFLKDWLMRHILSTDKYYAPDKLSSVITKHT